MPDTCETDTTAYWRCLQIMKIFFEWISLLRRIVTAKCCLLFRVSIVWQSMSWSNRHTDGLSWLFCDFMIVRCLPINKYSGRFIFRSRLFCLVSRLQLLASASCWSTIASEQFMFVASVAIIRESSSQYYITGICVSGATAAAALCIPASGRGSRCPIYRMHV